MLISDFITEGGGYIPQTEEEAHDPRYLMAITCDIHPGEDVKQAAKFNFKLGKGGIPPFLRSDGKITESIEIANPSLKFLATQPKIGWDFFGTVVMGQASNAIVNFIETHPNIEHYIISTTNSKTLTRELLPVLLKFGIDPSLFTDMIGYDEERAQKDYEYRLFKKAMICKELRIPVLVDDDPGFYEKECSRLGIKYINSDDCFTPIKTKNLKSKHRK